MILVLIRLVSQVLDDISFSSSEVRGDESVSFLFSMGWGTPSEDDLEIWEDGTSFLFSMGWGTPSEDNLEIWEDGTLYSKV